MAKVKFKYRDGTKYRVKTITMELPKDRYGFIEFKTLIDQIVKLIEKPLLWVQVL